MVDLKTSFLGLELKNPLVVSSCPFSSDPESVAQLEQAGIGAVVMRSIFEEQIREDVATMEASLDGDTSAAAMEYLRTGLAGRFGAESYLDTLADMRRRVKIPLVASVNCVEASNWVAYAKKIERVGADALELNLYHMPVDPAEDASHVEGRRLALIKAVLRETQMPVSIKLSPHYTSLLSFARAADALGVKGMVLFNRFLQTDVDVEKEEMFFAPEYSTPSTLHSQLRWAAVLRNRVKCNIAVSGGIHAWDGLVKALLVGANVGYVCSALYVRDDFCVIGEILAGLADWMGRKGYHCIDDFRGKLGERDLTDGKGFERVQYVKTAARIK
ncbi:MAG: dihydroorotate dehydrogenase-like protein [Kiritimatiellae bacterium]|nr:dihydroorotate dehydrogenase-like protein [Kiritimatiellia bacterium]